MAGGQGFRGCQVVGQTALMPSQKMPLHTVLALDDAFDITPSIPSFVRDGHLTNMGVECLVAGAGIGVWALPSSPGAHLQSLVVPAAEGKGYTCESLVADHVSGSIAISWRPRSHPTGVTGTGTLPLTARHRILQIQQPVAGVDGRLASVDGLFKVQNSLLSRSISPLHNMLIFLE